MKDIRIREAVEKDFQWFLKVSDEVAELHAKNVPWKFQVSEAESFPHSKFTDILHDNEQKLYVGEVEWRVVWFILYLFKKASDYTIMTQRDYLFVDSLWVLSEFHTCWIGKKLMELAESAARERGVKEIELDVRSFNKKALHFYEKWWYSAYNYKMRKEINL